MKKTKSRQKEVFLESEADEWFRRNLDGVVTKDYANDLIVKEINKIQTTFSSSKKISVIEVGAGHGLRLEYLLNQQGIASIAGIEPSKEAVKLAKSRGLTLTHGSADDLPFESGTFDVLIFGFCLYLCDREDLFKIAYEADRVLKDKGWIIINDFYASSLVKRSYHHKEGVSTFKMDYRTLFDWNPAYTCYSHKILPHERKVQAYTDDKQEWMAVSVLRKNLDSYNK